MDAREPADFACDRADLRELASIRTTAIAQHILAEDLFFQVPEHFSGHLSLFRLIVRIALDDFLLERIDRGITGQLIFTSRVERLAETVPEILLHLADRTFIKLVRY